MERVHQHHSHTANFSRTRPNAESGYTERKGHGSHSHFPLLASRLVFSPGVAQHTRGDDARKKKGGGDPCVLHRAAVGDPRVNGLGAALGIISFGYTTPSYNLLFLNVCIHRFAAETHASDKRYFAIPKTGTKPIPRYNPPGSLRGHQVHVSPSSLTGHISLAATYHSLESVGEGTRRSTSVPSYPTPQNPSQSQLPSSQRYRRY